MGHDLDIRHANSTVIFVKVRKINNWVNPQRMFVSFGDQGPVVQSVVSLTSSLRVISLTVLADSIHNFLILFC